MSLNPCLTDKLDIKGTRLNFVFMRAKGVLDGDFFFSLSPSLSLLRFYPLKLSWGQQRVVAEENFSAKDILADFSFRALLMVARKS